MRDTRQYSIRRERLFTMIILQKSQRQAPLSWNPSDVRTRECGSSTSTRRQPWQPQQTQQLHSKQSMSFLNFPAPRDIPLVSCICGLPNKSNVHRCRPQWKLLHMAETHCDSHQPVLPGLRRNDQRAFKGATSRNTFHKTGSIRKNHQKRRSEDKDQR